MAATSFLAVDLRKPAAYRGTPRTCEKRALGSGAAAYDSQKSSRAAGSGG